MVDAQCFRELFTIRSLCLPEVGLEIHAVSIDQKGLYARPFCMFINLMHGSTLSG
jgi:hypothetical protein